MRHSEGEPLDMGDLPYEVLRTIVAARFGVRPREVDRWPADEFGLAVATIGVRV